MLVTPSLRELHQRLRHLERSDCEPTAKFQFDPMGWDWFGVNVGENNEHRRT
jgi:hypothetical protein